MSSSSAVTASSKVSFPWLRYVDTTSHSSLYFIALIIIDAEHTMLIKRSDFRTITVSSSTVDESLAVSANATLIVPGAAANDCGRRNPALVPSPSWYAAKEDNQRNKEHIGCRKGVVSLYICRYIFTSWMTSHAYLWCNSLLRTVKYVRVDSTLFSAYK